MSWFEGCPDAGPVAGYAFLLSDPVGVNSYDQDLICEAGGERTGLGLICPDLAGTQGDGRVAVWYDWGYGAIGCPDLSLGPDGSGRLVVIAAPENGASLVTSVGYSTALSGYMMDAAHPYNDPTVAPLSCSPPGAGVVSLDGMSSSGGTLTADVTTHPPTVFSDCDPGTAGGVLGTCPEGPSAVPAVGPGRFYTRTAICPDFGGKPVLGGQAYAFAADPDAGGRAQISVPAPTAGYCVMIGASFSLGGVETPAMGGYVAIPSGQPCADADHDGFFDCLNDCDDHNAAAFPGNPEVCDGVDNNCNGQIDEGIVCAGGCFPPQVSAGDLPVGGRTWYWGSDVSLVSDGSGYGVAWFAEEQYPDDRVLFARLDATGAQIGPTVQVSDTTFRSSYPSLVWNGTGYALAWMDSRDGQYEIYFARLDASGTPIGANQRVTFTQAGASTPSLVWSGQEYGVAWYDNRDSPYHSEVYFARLSAAGVKIGSDVRITTIDATKTAPTLVWNGSGYGVAWSDWSSGSPHVYLARLDPAGTMLGTASSIGNGSDFPPSVVWTGSTYGIAWSYDTFQNLYFALLDASGTPVVPAFRLTSDDSLRSSGPSLAWTGSEFGIGWYDGRNSVTGDYEIYFASLTAGGERIGQDVQVTRDLLRSFSPSLAWNGDGFAVAWPEMDNSNTNFQPKFTRIGCDAPDRDGDGFLAAVNDCDDTRRDINPAAEEICDGIDNDCDGVVDNIRNGPPSACNLTDGVIWVAMPDHTAVSWQPEAMFPTFNVYRGDLAVLRSTGTYTQDPGTIAGASQSCGVAGTQTLNGPDPTVGHGFFYLVTGVNGAGGESSLGNDSAGHARPNVHPCQ